MSKVLWSAPSLSLRIVQTDEKSPADIGGLAILLECCCRKDSMGERQWDIVERTPVLDDLIAFVVRHRLKPTKDVAATADKVKK